MGYSYSIRSGRLACDGCPSDIGVRKCRCPFGWCPAPALCADCRKKHGQHLSAPAHRERRCDLYALQAQLRDAEKAGLFSRGLPVRCAALSVGEDRVHVLFATDAHQRRCVGYYMPSAAYAAIPLIGNATPDDYRRFGSLTPAPDSFDFRPASMEAPAPDLLETTLAALA